MSEPYIVEHVSTNEKLILDLVRKVKNDSEKVAYISTQTKLYVELEDIYHSLTHALQNMQEAMSQGEVRQDVQEAADRIYRLLR